MNKISENIKKKRLENNLTQQEVAEKLYVTRQCISRWEQGITLPDINNIEKLAEIFNCNTNDIIDHDSIKIITISEAIKNRKTKKIILTSILISLLAIWMSLLGILLINRNNKIDDSENIKYLRAIVFDINSDEIKFKLDKEQVPEDQSRDFVLPLTETLNIKVFNNFKKQIDLSELKLKDIVQLSYYNELNSQNIEVIHLIDSEVEKSFYGVIVVANGQHYESYEDIPTDGTPGIRFFLHEEKLNSGGNRHNMGFFEASSKFSYDEINGVSINPKYEYEMNIYFDSLKAGNDPVIGLVYSTGIEYVETLDRNWGTSRVYEGEQGYELPEGIYFNHSVDLSFKINFNLFSSFNKLEIYEYDANNELLEVTTLFNWNDLFDFSANKDTIYAYFKEFYTKGSYETYKTYKLNVGEHVVLPISDEYGFVWKETFVYSYKGY